MSGAISTMSIGKQICEALHLPPRTRNIDVRMHIDEAVTITCEFYPDRTSVETLIKHLALFEARPRRFIPGAMSRFDVGTEHILPERAPERRTP